MIEKDQYVKVVFKNSTQAEGYVESWSDTESVLISADGLSKFVIFNTKEDILAVKIHLEKPEEKVHQTFEELVDQFKEVQEQPSNDDLRLHNLAQLKIMMNQQERKIISEKIKEHTISEVRLPKYGFPSISKKPSTK